MKKRNFRDCALSSCAAAALLAGCAVRQAQDDTPSIAAPGAMQQNTAGGTRAIHGRSWMRPDAKSGDLIYVTSTKGEVYVFSYSDGKQVGTLTGFAAPMGDCSDRSGNVFITDFENQDIIEYAHGASVATRTLYDGYYPFACSVDPTTGRVAVTNAVKNYEGGVEAGNIEIYEPRNGTSLVFTDPDIIFYQFCTYDASGNLYIDGYPRTGPFSYAVLRAGQSGFTDFSLDPSLYADGDMQWDGKYVVVGKADASIVYRIRLSGSKAAVVGKTELDGIYHSFPLVQFSIQDDQIVVPYEPQHSRDGNVGTWNYPSGGKPVRSIDDISSASLFGLTVSVAR